MSVALVDGGEVATYDITENRAIWVHIALGEVIMNSQSLVAGDGAAIIDESELIFEKGKNAEIIIFDMQPISVTHS